MTREYDFLIKCIGLGIIAIVLVIAFLVEAIPDEMKENEEARKKLCERQDEDINLDMEE